MKITIVGGGHIGTTLACYIKHHEPRNNVSLFTRKPRCFQTNIKCNDWEKGFSFEEKIDCISNDPSIAANKADIIFIALPHFAVEKAFKDIAPFVSEKAFVGVIPGGGGCEFFYRKYFAEQQTLFGLQRVPFTAKLEKYGQETNLKSWKPYSVVATQKASRVDAACEMIEACGLRTRKAPNYLSVSLTPTNPILHTSRTYEIFSQFPRSHVYKEKCKFYVGWTDETSEIMLAMDDELHKCLAQITEFDTNAILPLTEHYESMTVEAMTQKINSIATFQSVYAPMAAAENTEGFVADISSRMFTEDFPWGLAIFRAYCLLVNTPAPTMDRLLNWYASYMGLKWYVNNQFCGTDLKLTGIPQNYGVKTYKQLLSYYT